MNTKKAIEIASRIYGLYLLVQIPFSVSGLFSIFAVNQEEFIKNPFLFKIWAVLHPLFYIIVATFLIFKAEKIANFVAGKSKDESKTKTNDTNYSRLSFWLSLLGVYFFISATSSLIQHLIRYPIHWGDSYFWSIFLSHCFTIIAGVFLILKMEWVESKLVRRLER